MAYACSQKNSKPMLCSKPRENQKSKKPNFLEKFWFQVQRCFFWFSLSFLNCRWFKNPDRLKQSGRGSKQKLCPNPSLHPTSNIGLPPQCQKGQQAHQRKLGSNLLDRDFVTESHGKGGDGEWLRLNGVNEVSCNTSWVYHGSSDICTSLHHFLGKKTPVHAVYIYNLSIVSWAEPQNSFPISSNLHFPKNQGMDLVWQLFYI